MKQLVVAAFLLVLAIDGDAYAQVDDVQPPNPTSADYIVLRVGTDVAAVTLRPVVISGSNILITFRGDGNVPSVGTKFVPLGRLPAGTYSVVVTFEYTFGGDEVQHTVTLDPFVLVVTAGAETIPLLDFSALVVLVIALAMAAVVALRAA